MKQFLLIIMCALIYALFPSPASAQIKEAVSLEKALTLAQGRFEGQDVDYYLVGNSKNDVWSIFVDAEPLKGWEHDCYILNIPKSKEVNTIPAIRESKLRIPPDNELKPLAVKNRIGDKANDKPYVSKATLSNEAMEVADRTYAIILSGGVNRNSNHERYWNDCSYVYQVLTHKYGIPKSNIYVIMADGTNPAADMRTINGEYKSSPLDLDGDGTADIKYSATLANIHSVLSQLSNTIKQDDQLLFYVIDHGGSNDNMSKSYINLWGNEKLQDYTLASWLEPILNKKAVVNCVLGQCYSGGFIDDLTRKGCVVSTASAGNEMSWACSDRPYDEFVYQWTSAINEQDTYNHKILSDVDGNKRVTMEEAFACAKANDRRTNEHPQFQSTPLSVGEDLAFNHLAPSADIYVKDNDEDTGKEPNTTTSIFWNSPSICVRNNNDSIFVHENPVYNPDHVMAYIYVRVYNRGREKFTGKKYMHIYWALASTDINSKVWKGREVFDDYPSGGHLDAVPITDIEAGSYKDIELDWNLPGLLKTRKYGNFHFCLLAKIMDKAYDDGYVDGKTYYNLRDSNNHAQKNLIIIDGKKYNACSIFIRNTFKEDKSFTLELVPRTLEDAEYYSKANVVMEMGPKIFDAWKQGGFEADNIERESEYSNALESPTVKYTSPQSKIKNICLKGGEFDTVKLNFDFYKAPLKEANYVLDLIQRDEDGNIVGGETFKIEAPLTSGDKVNINSEPSESGSYRLTVDNAENYNSIKWINEQDKVLGNKDTITVVPTINENSYSVNVVDKDGYLKTGNISLNVDNYIYSISVSDQPKEILVKLGSPAPNNAGISIVSISDGSLNTYSVEEGKKETVIDGSALSNGVYVVNYLINNGIIDQKKINIK